VRGGVRVSSAQSRALVVWGGALKASFVVLPYTVQSNGYANSSFVL